MRKDDRDVLATVAKLNKDMGAIVLSLLEGAHDEGSLRPGRLRELAAICDDLSALLDNHADKLEGKDRIVIDGDVSPERPADAQERQS